MPSRNRMRRYAAGVIALFLFTTACGLKKEAMDALSQSGGAAGPGVLAPGAVVDPTTGAVVPGTGGQPGATAGPGGVVAPGPGGAPGGGAPPPGGGGGAPPPGGGGGQPPPGGGGGQQPSGGNSTGITKDTIRIGIHAPITGAAPLPANAFRSGAEMWWKKNKVFGRQVVVEVMDDRYTPSTARSVCESMSNRNFLIVGGAGTDQIQACATDPVLARQGTPYLSAGVTTNGLTKLPNYFAISLTYAEQSSVVYKNAQQQGVDVKKWAVALTEGPNFDDAMTSITQVLKSKGAEYKVFRMPKYGSDSDAARTAQQLAQYNAPIVYFLSAPRYWISVVSQSSAQLYRPTWTGPGVSMGVNTVGSTVCELDPQVKATYTSPFHGLDREPQSFKEAGPESNANDRDVQMMLFGISQVIHKALLATGGNLTRENFVAQLPKQTLTTEIFPAARFNGGHFGGTAAWSLRLDCGRRQWVTRFPSPITP